MNKKRASQTAADAFLKNDGSTRPAGVQLEKVYANVGNSLTFH